MEREVRQLEEDVAEIKKVLVSPESCPSPRKQRFKVGPSCCGLPLLPSWLEPPSVLMFGLNVCFRWWSRGSGP